MSNVPDGKISSSPLFCRTTHCTGVGSHFNCNLCDAASGREPLAGDGIRLWSVGGRGAFGVSRFAGSLMAQLISFSPVDVRPSLGCISRPSEPCTAFRSNCDVTALVRLTYRHTSAAPVAGRVMPKPTVLVSLTARACIHGFNGLTDALDHELGEFLCESIQTCEPVASRQTIAAVACLLDNLNSDPCGDEFSKVFDRQVEGGEHYNLVGSDKKKSDVPCCPLCQSEPPVSHDDKKWKTWYRERSPVHVSTYDSAVDWFWTDPSKPRLNSFFSVMSSRSNILFDFDKSGHWKRFGSEHSWVDFKTVPLPGSELIPFVKQWGELLDLARDSKESVESTVVNGKAVIPSFIDRVTDAAVFHDGSDDDMVDEEPEGATAGSIVEVDSSDMMYS